jgi:hypothetical protein
MPKLRNEGSTLMKRRGKLNILGLTAMLVVCVAAGDSGRML